MGFLLASLLLCRVSLVLPLYLFPLSHLLSHFPILFPTSHCIPSPTLFFVFFGIGTLTHSWKIGQSHAPKRRRHPRGDVAKGLLIWFRGPRMDPVVLPTPPPHSHDIWTLYGQSIIIVIMMMIIITPK